jgi:hypothetical protein
MPIYDNLMAATKAFDPVMKRNTDPFGGGLRPGGFIPPDKPGGFDPNMTSTPLPTGTARGGFIPGQVGRIFGPKPAPMVDPMGGNMPTQWQGPIGRRQRLARRTNPGGWGGGITGYF